MFEAGSLWNYIACVLLASFGGLARILAISNASPVTRKMVFREVILSTFTGVVVMLICKASDVQLEYIGAVCGCAGYMGITIIMKIVTPLFKQKVGIELDKEEKKE